MGFEDEAVSLDQLDAPRAERGETVLVVDEEPTVQMPVTSARGSRLLCRRG